MQECGRRFRFIFHVERKAKRDTFGLAAYAHLQQTVDEFETWKDIVSGGNKANLEGLTFYEFMFRLNKEVGRLQKEKAKAQKPKQ